MGSEFERQVDEGSSMQFSGWDFAPIATRWRTRKPPWDCAGLVREKMRTSNGMLDLGTRGGEFLAARAPLPPDCFATEGYPPNFMIAQ
jgi:hypothetical protein